MPYRFYQVDVFTDKMFGGNPLAVFPDAEGLTEAEMQALANEMNLSETTFVFAPDDHEDLASVRIFTPGTELPFAGHPTIGTARPAWPDAVEHIFLPGEDRSDSAHIRGGPTPSDRDLDATAPADLWTAH
jgi:predicted PhzF superfamily epimerase YddE/YHI9